MQKHDNGRATKRRPDQHLKDAGLLILYKLDKLVDGEGTSLPFCRFIMQVSTPHTNEQEDKARHFTIERRYRGRQTLPCKKDRV